MWLSRCKVLLTPVTSVQMCIIVFPVLAGIYYGGRTFTLPGVQIPHHLLGLREIVTSGMLYYRMNLLPHLAPSWILGKFQLARWSQKMAIFPEGIPHPSTHPSTHPSVNKTFQDFKIFKIRIFH